MMGLECSRAHSEVSSCRITVVIVVEGGVVLADR